MFSAFDDFKYSIWALFLIALPVTALALVLFLFWSLLA